MWCFHVLHFHLVLHPCSHSLLSLFDLVCLLGVARCVCCITYTVFYSLVWKTYSTGDKQAGAKACLQSYKCTDTLFRVSPPGCGWRCDMKYLPADKAAGHFICTGLRRRGTPVGPLTQSGVPRRCNLVQIKWPVAFSTAHHTPAAQAANLNKIQPLTITPTVCFLPIQVF